MFFVHNLPIGGLWTKSNKIGVVSHPFHIHFHRKNFETFELERVGRFFILGSCIIAPCLRVWYCLLDKVVKTAGDQFLSHCVAVCTQFCLSRSCCCSEEGCPRPGPVCSSFLGHVCGGFWGPSETISSRHQVQTKVRIRGYHENQL